MKCIYRFYLLLPEDALICISGEILSKRFNILKKDFNKLKVLVILFLMQLRASIYLLFLYSNNISYYKMNR